MAPNPQAQFKQRLYKALGSKNLALALDRGLPMRRRVRAQVLPPAEFDALRAELRRRKQASIDRLPELVAEFTANAQKAGATVHMAATIDDALAVIGGLVDKHGVRRVVKSKSMASEEIGVNEYLEERKVRVVETDLGEWIVQLAHEKPSHLVTPAMHKTREEVAELFSEYTGEKVPDDIPTLVAVARKHLRQEFIDADMGITGANVAVAETGSLMIISNEGNARLVSTLPPIHVAILGIEKIMPSLDDAVAVLRVLSKSATGQPLTTYISFITGPSRTADIELSLTIGVHGPKEVHIILLDNGRTRMRSQPEYRNALTCIRCSACLNACPAFQAVGGHAFGHRYTGPIGLILTSFHHGNEYAEGPQSLCMSCNACEPVCPVGIELPRMILDLRQEVGRDKPPGFVKKQVLNTLSYQDDAQLLLKIGRMAQMPFANDTSVRIPGVTGWRSLPRLPGKGFLERHAPGETFAANPAVPSGAEGTSVLYFPGCITDNLSPETGEAAVEALTGLGATVTLPPWRQCCGLAHMNAGDEQTAIALAKQTIEMFASSLAVSRGQGESGAADARSARPAPAIVSTSPSCVACMVQDYPHLLRHEPEWAARAQAMSARIQDFATFVDKVAQLKPGDLTPRPGERDPLLRDGAGMDRPLSAGSESGTSPLKREKGMGEIARRDTFTYHDSCQSTNCLKLGPEQRRLLCDVMGMDLKEMEESSMCCGFGGTFSLDYPRVSARVLNHKLDHIKATGAPLVATDNPGCILHIRGGLDAAGEPTQVAHIAELVADRLAAVRRMKAT